MGFSFLQALSFNAMNGPQQLIQQAIALHSRGQFEQASAIYREVLTRDGLQSLYRTSVIAVEGAADRAFLPG